MEYALKENELIPLTFDIMFTEIFNNPDNICILEEFISNYLDIPLKEVSGNLKILSRKHKDYIRGGTSRIKHKKYKILTQNLVAINKSL